MNLPVALLGSGFLLLPFLSFTPAEVPDSAPPRYVGAKACKSCHNGDAKGEVHDKWSNGPHAQAFEVLASAKAKEIGAGLKIEDPQKSADCLKCHVTAYDVDAKLKKRGLREDEGVGCESCHGPGENHVTTRMQEAEKGGDASPVSAEEISVKRELATCTKCHNKESPTFKPFCLKERMKKIQHLDPRKKRTPEEIKALEETCSPGCEVCGGVK
jgi:hypothetical protein